MPYTISTQNGPQVSREHNIRNPKVVSKEKHIDPNGHFEIWKDEKIRDAYQRIFGESVREYNEKQTRKDRMITDYYNEIKNHKTKNTAYELIISVGSKKEPVDPELGKEIMRKYFDTWEMRNANLEVIGAYYHADEEGVPHVHIDYVPVAEDYERGMRTQNGIARALEQMGFVKTGKETEQMQWQKTENTALESICKDRGLEIYHPEEENRIHLDIQTYKAKMELENILERVMTLDNSIAEKQAKLDEITEKVEELQGTYEKEIANQEAVLDKDIFGRQKKKVTIDYSEFRRLELAAEEANKLKEIKSLEIELRERERVLNEKSKDIDERKVALEEKIKTLETHIEERVDLKVKRKTKRIQKELALLKDYVKDRKFDDGKDITKGFEKELKSLEKDELNKSLFK